MIIRPTVKYLFIVLSVSLSANGIGIDLSQDAFSNDLEDVEEERFFAFPIIIPGGLGGGGGGGGGGGFNLTNAFGMAGMAGMTALAGILGLVPLLGLGGLLAGLLLNYDDRLPDRYPDTVYRSFSSGPSWIDWSRLSIIDWVSVGEETFRKFDPSDLDCQKRFICEIHQNTIKFGHVAEKIVQFISYFQYLKDLRIPEQLFRLIDEYQEAADRGKSMNKDCGQVYSHCEFSVKNIFDRITVNHV